MAQYKLAVTARQDFDQMLDDLLEREGRPGAIRFIETLAAAWDFLAENPEAGHFREDLADKPLKFWTAGRWFMGYRSTTHPIEILYLGWARSDWVGRLTRENDNAADS